MKGQGDENKYRENGENIVTEQSETNSAVERECSYGKVKGDCIWSDIL